jgi:hypothetical protein
MILYILYFTVKEKVIFDWGKLISIEISSQLSHYKREKKLFMDSYLVFVIVYCCQFPKLIVCKRVKNEIDPVTFWYQALWRHKTSLHFYEVYNDFVSVFKGLLFGKNNPRIFEKANKFLEKKGTIEQMENHSVIRIFCSKENPSFLPHHVSDKNKKNVVQEEEEYLIENDINSFSLEDMELEADIEKMFPTIDQPRNIAQQNSSLEVIENDTFSEEESSAFQSVVSDKESKKLIIEKGYLKIRKENLVQRLT